MMVNDQLKALVALPAQNPQTPTREEEEWIPEPIWFP
jgi:hypothetical protein